MVSAAHYYLKAVSLDGFYQEEGKNTHSKNRGRGNERLIARGQFTGQTGAHALLMNSPGKYCHQKMDWILARHKP